MFFRKNRGVWGIVFCVSKTRQYPNMANPAKDLLCHSAKKREGKAKILPHYCISRRAVRHSAACPAIALAAADAVIKRGWISPCGGAGGAISPLQNKRRAERGDAVSPLKKSYLPILGTAQNLKIKSSTMYLFNSILYLQQGNIIKRLFRFISI